MQDSNSPDASPGDHSEVRRSHYCRTSGSWCAPQRALNTSQSRRHSSHTHTHTNTHAHLPNGPALSLLAPPHLPLCAKIMTSRARTKMRERVVRCTCAPLARPWGVGEGWQLWLWCAPPPWHLYCVGVPLTLERVAALSRSLLWFFRLVLIFTPRRRQRREDGAG